MPAFYARKAFVSRLYSIPSQPANTYILPAPEFDVSGYTVFIVCIQLGPGATAATDVNPYFQPVDANGLWAGIAIPASRVIANSLAGGAGGTAIKITEYNVTGLARIRMNVANLNATLALPLTLDVFMQ